MHRVRPRPESARLRIGFFGVLGSGNLGNDASLDALVTFLQEHHPDAEIGFFAMGPDVLEGKYAAPAVSLQWYEANMVRLSWVPATVLKIVGRLLDPIRTLAWARQHDVVIVPGMGVLETTAPSRPWGLPFSMLCLGLAGRISGVRVALVCVGADQIPNRLTRWLVTGAARLAHYRSYRDQLSHDAMRDMGVDVSEDQVYPDLAFALPVPPPREPCERSIAVGLMNYRGAEHDRHRAVELHGQYVDRVGAFVAFLVDSGWQVRLFAGDVEDDPIIEQVFTSVRRSRPSATGISTKHARSLTDLMETLGDVELVVATRYHNVLAALHLSIPTLSISYARKSDVLMQSMGLGDFCQDAARIDMDALLERFHALEARRHELAETLQRRNGDQTEALARQFDALSEFLVPGLEAKRPVGR